MIADPEWEEWLQKPSASKFREQGDAIGVIINDKEFFCTLKCYVFIAEPVIRLMRMADSAKPGSICKVYKLASEVQDNIDLVAKHAQTKGYEYLKMLQDAHQVSALQTAWQKRWRDLHSPFHAAGYALDPEFAFNDVALPDCLSNRNDEIRRGLLDALRKVFKGDSDQVSAALTEHARFLAGEGLFGEPEIRKSAKSTPAYLWWRLNGDKTPTLQRAAMRICAQISSSSVTERTWSDFDYIHNKRRNRLAAARATKLVKVYGHLRLMHKKKDADGSIPWHWWSAEEQQEEIAQGQQEDGAEEGEAEEDADDDDDI
jgi:hypothetical protein